MSNRVVLVTGASSGIGEATATRLAAAGFTVYGAARRVDRIAQLPGVIPIEMDITDDGQVSAAVQRIIDEQGCLDALVNNAGYAQYGPVEDISIDAARRQFDVNIFGLARLTQLVIPHMRAQGKGTIVNVSSMGGRIYTPLGAWYHATKHALEGWSDCLRIELKPMGIDVVIIEPGGIATEFGDVLAQHTAEVSAPYADLHGKVVRFLSDPSSTSRLSPPTLIADTILKAIQSSKPKARYMAGYLAKPMWRLRRFGGDGVYDRALNRVLR